MIYDLKKASAKLGISEDSLRNHIENFYKDFNTNLSTIEGAIETDDPDRIYFEFHKLKSTFRMISARKAEEICRVCCDKSIEKISYEYAKALEDIIQSFESIYNLITGRDS